jgi:hypothetical protein
MGALVVVVMLCAADGGVRPPYLPAPAEAETAQARYRLERDPGKGWRYDDARFGARIGEDGSVSFADHHGTIGLLLPLPLPLPEGTPSLESALRGLKGRNLRPAPLPSGTGILVSPPGTPPRMSPYRPSPSEECVYPRPCFFQAGVMFLTVAGTFDLTDEILRLGHSDPYRAQKAQFLASTAAFRLDLRTRTQNKLRERALAELRVRLGAIAHEGRPRADQVAEMRALEEDLDAATAAPARTLIDAAIRDLSAR